MKTEKVKRGMPQRRYLRGKMDYMRMEGKRILKFVLDESEGFGVMNCFWGEFGKLESSREGRMYRSEHACGHVVVNVEGLQNLAGFIIVAEQNG